ncbi:NAD(P)/FAD-dependent oxidoreductase [Pseudodonghicola flavimaris]|uniref:FAD-binding oxidoreductase n=1 Tax=Pseudodonghicola flavimaris TaxID=3050036 RepID=A0ABT7EUV5_9RHOB|nr:FAD-binding oxidoreductase [Pseudodonghicola flavimaris]MDK3016079.1 FAD-binding oxidoreductase [Pseudodonghicola flavimaris]
MGLNLLYSNDTPGSYPDSWYAATAPALDPFAALETDTRADVCIVGAGFTGLSAALHLAEAGLDVVLLEANRVGFGASGRNGGQLGSGQRLPQDALEKLTGRTEADKLWQLAEEAKAITKGLIARHGIDCDLRPGVAWSGSSKGDVQHLHDYGRHLQDRYGYRSLELLDREAFHALCPSPDYRGGIVDWDAAHLHPLKYALGLARAAAGAGVRLFERTEVQAIEEGAQVRLKTAGGTVTADHVILACNGYLGGLEKRVASRVMPINNFIIATEPLGADTAKVLTKDIAVADSRFVVNYFRLSPDGRLLFGGGESYGYRFPASITDKVRKPMLEIYPHLRDVRIDYAWGGTLAITMKRMPYLTRLRPNVLSASGYSGHGVGTATHAGYLIAEAIRGEAAGFDTMAQVPNTPFPGGPGFRTPLLVLAMTWFGLRDRLGI